jgi:hypothetical protein
MELYPYTKGEQFKTYLSQVMRVFSGFQYDAGDGELRRIPVIYGGMHRIVANVLQKQDPFGNTQIPLMAVNLRSIDLDQSNKRNARHVDYIPNLMQPVEKRTIAARATYGHHYLMGIDLSIYASSNSELFEILEQLLLIFNPRVTINVDTNVVSGSYLSEISLSSIQSEIQYPLGAEKQIVMMTLGFNVPVRLTYPHVADAAASDVDDIHTTILKTITTNVSVNNESNVI